MTKQTVMMTLDEAAKFLRNMAELTSKGTRDWNNFEGICKDILKSLDEYHKEKQK